MYSVQSTSARPYVFLTIIWLKIIDAILGIIAAILILAIPQATVMASLHRIFQRELLEDPRDMLAQVALRSVSDASVSTQHFVAAYLFINGVLKIVLLTLIIQKKYWAYRLTAVCFALIALYELYRYVYISHSTMLILFILFDVYLIYHLWQAHSNTMKQV